MKRKKVTVLLLVILAGSSLFCLAQDTPKKVEAFLRFFNENYWNTMPDSIKGEVDTIVWSEAIGVAYRIEIQKKDALPDGPEKQARKAHLETLWYELAQYIRAVGDSSQYRQNGYSGDKLFNAMNRGFWSEGIEENPLVAAQMHRDAFRPSYFDSTHHRELPSGETQGQIVGVWHGELRGFTSEMNFGSDGRFSGWGSNGSHKEHWSGNYWHKDGEIIFQYDKTGKSEAVPLAIIDPNTIAIDLPGTEINFIYKRKK